MSKTFDSLESFIRYFIPKDSTWEHYLQEVKFNPNEETLTKFSYVNNSSHYDIFEKVTIKRNLLQVAIESGSLEAVQYLVTKGADLEKICYMVEKVTEKREYHNGQGQWGGEPDNTKITTAVDQYTPVQYAKLLKKSKILSFLEKAIQEKSK
jgi:hypothetical protein